MMEYKGYLLEDGDFGRFLEWAKRCFYCSGSTEHSEYKILDRDWDETPLPRFGQV